MQQYKGILFRTINRDKLSITRILKDYLVTIQTSLQSKVEKAQVSSYKAIFVNEFVSRFGENDEVERKAAASAMRSVKQTFEQRHHAINHLVCVHCVNDHKEIARGQHFLVQFDRHKMRIVTFFVFSSLLHRT